ncbi:hypothetical protein JCM3765_002037 [Sporobolomyces pararoseus]
MDPNELRQLYSDLPPLPLPARRKHPARRTHRYRITAYDNVLQVVYSSSSEQREGGGASPEVRSLLEICARQIGWEIETSIRDWLDQVRNDHDSDSEGEWTIEEMELHLNREAHSKTGRNRLKKDYDCSDNEAEEEEPTSRRTSASSFTNMSGVQDLSRGEQDLESSRIQDEAYESCPSHTYRWILAEHATSIVYHELCDLFERSDELPYELVEIWYDWCSSYGANSEASRFHSLLISTALRPISQPSSTPKTSFIPLLLKSPSPLSLLSSLESHLSESTFQDKLFFHPYLTTTASNTLISMLGTIELKKIEDYLEMMIKLASTMIGSYLNVYRNETRELHSRSKSSQVGTGLEEGLEKDTREIFERILKLVGAITGDTALRNVTALSSRKKGKRSTMGTRQGILGGLTRLSAGGGVEELEGLRTEVGGLWKLSQEIEKIVARNGSFDSDTEDEADEDKLPTTSQQLGSIVLYLDLVALSRSPTASTSLSQIPSTKTSASTVCIPLSSHYISTYLVPSISPNSLLLVCDKLIHLSESQTVFDTERAILMALGGGGVSSEYGEDFGEEVERRWSGLAKKSEEQQKIVKSDSRLDRTKHSLSAGPFRAPSIQNSASSNAQVNRKSSRQTRSFDLTSESEVDHFDSDSEVIIVSPSQSPEPRSPPLLPSHSARRFLVAPLPPPARFNSGFVSSEPDELAILPPPRRFLASQIRDSPPRKPKQKRPRMSIQAPLSPSPPAPFESYNFQQVSSVKPRSPDQPPSRKIERREKVAPLRKRLECHVRTHSAPTVLLQDITSKSTRQEEDEDDELMMSF